MNSTLINQIIQDYIPEAARTYCLELADRYHFEFRLRKSRVTKVGDFTCYPGKTPRITVNRDIDPYLFLITYVHEVAHLDVHLKYGNKIESHGREWKLAFQELMKPILNENIFPKPLLDGLRKHLINPKASTFSDSKFTQLLRTYDSRQKNVTLLSELPEGSVFGFHGKWFKKGKLRRTRVECKEIKTRLNYLVPADAPISMAQLSLSLG